MTTSLIRLTSAAALAATLLVPQSASATRSTYFSAQVQTPPSRVTRVVIDRREAVENVDTGASGPYEKLVGKAFLEADPSDPHNTIITDLDKAPRNARGMVEYSTDVYILKPVDMRLGNRKLLFEINNRGNKNFGNRYNDAQGTVNVNDPTAPEDFGDALLLRQGYAIAWAGWEGDVQPGADRMTIQIPIAGNPAAPLTGPVAVTFDVARQIPMTGAVSLPLSGRPEIASHEAATLDTSAARLTMRELIRSQDVEVPSDRWAFATCERNPGGGVQNVKPSGTNICVFDGFDPNRQYLLTYTAKNPRPEALGFAAMRDVISFLRYDAADDDGTPNPLGTGINHAICSGVSQSGHVLRSYLYLGFNEDTAGRRTCDGALAYISGANRSELNTRFASPEQSSTWGRPGIFPRTIFPFSYAVTTDPVTGRTDGILKRPESDPLVMQIDSGNEYWQANASLVQYDGLGNPITLPDNARYYFMSSAQHGSNVAPSRGICEQLTNPLSHAAFSRALLVAMDGWVTDGIEPPPSQYPSREDGTLVSPDQASVGFPKIPGVTFGGVTNPITAREYGPAFSATGGIPSFLPGEVMSGAEYRVFVPRTDSDGLDVAGLRRPDDLGAPLATHAGWNTRGPGFRAGDLCGLNGMFVPFARTEAERQSNGDPRPSIEARYPTHSEYVDRVTAAAQSLRDQHYLLTEDMDRIIAQAEQRQVP
ncbi:MAG TPA: alpha/beta hydrolase domain-containing protein [Chloroflexota bacterium]|nr:alpha/beta hydrolase domain-containing protein [Chloroflexota bacterium]